MLVPVKYFCRLKILTLLTGVGLMGMVAFFNPPAVSQQAELRQLEEFLAPPPTAFPEPQQLPAAAPLPAVVPEQFSTPDNTAAPVRNNPSNPQVPQERPSQVSNPRNPSPARPGTERVESSNVAVRATSIPRLELGPEYGEGNFIVLMTYDGEDSLTLAREYSAGAFVKQVEGDPYIQLAVFDQLEYARHLASRLRNQGLSVLVAN
ncbi:MAG: hypothetical protein AB4050_05130 [Synechococcus sp.]